MANIKLLSGKERIVKMLVTPAILEKVEKWSETSFTTTSQLSGGGGHIYQGSGYIDPVSFTSTLSSVNTRHTRLYYKTDTVSDAITAYGFDLPVIEGTQIDLVWYVCDGFHNKIAGFLDHRTNTWFMLNAPQDYLMSWLGVTWINLPYIRKNSIITGAVILISFIINFYLGIVVGILGGIFAYIAFARPMITYLRSKDSYIDYIHMFEVDSQLRKDFLQALNLK